ncbi:hypothetical protein KY347_06785 [Candidatus Woesearchaeota archaeon]|nr:hypothetical protein [Candidatus Woesearchaeota archaeon]
MKKLGILLILLLVLAPAVFPISLQDLIGFFNFDYSTAEITVTGSNDFMIDTNGNNISDMLVIELTTGGSEGNYVISVELHGETIIKNETSKNLNTGTNKFNISFSSDFFTKSKLNYTIKIYDENYSLKYSRENIETQYYENYETAIKIVNISDASAGNDYIQLNLTIGFAESNAYEIVSYLKYNNSVIFERINGDIAAGLNSLLVNFSSEKIKSTHYAGRFNLTGIKLNNNVIKTDYETNFYDYKDFAQSSYFTGFSDYGSDLNSNNLYEHLMLDAGVEIKEQGDYKVELAVYDLFGNFIGKAEKTESLASGENNVPIGINGTEICNKKINGPFIVKYARLVKGNDVIDQLNNAYTTGNYNYAEFEKPDLPDLDIKINVSGDFHYGKSNADFDITVKNTGSRPAFNVFLDIFDNSTYSREEYMNILMNGDSISYKAEFANISDMELTAVADFDNFVEESNESNNIITRTAKINKKPELEEIKDLIVNENDLIVIAANATDNNSDALTFSINYSEFSQDNNVFSWQTADSDAGDYTVMVIVSDGFLHDSRVFQITVLDKGYLDSDNDTIEDSVDNCPNLYNPTQITDFDFDGFDNLLCYGLDCNDDNSLINPSAEELCNNIDDNCNNQADENLERACGVSDIGICTFGAEACESGVWKNCDAVMPQQEVCNDIDDDCDGAIDNNCARLAKEYAIELLENAKDNLPCKKWRLCRDRVIGRVIANIEKSLNPDYFIDDETLNPEKGRDNGKYVFEFERKAAIECPTGYPGKILGIGALCKEVSDYLKSADKRFAEKALQDAKSAAVKNQRNRKCYDKKIKKAEELLLRAEDLISRRFPIIAIEFCKKSWENSIEALRIADSEKRVC